MADVSFFIDLLENQPPYKRVGITLNDYMALSEGEQIKIDGVCMRCGKERTFLSTNMASCVSPLRKELSVHCPKPKGILLDASMAPPKDGPECYATSFFGVLFKCVSCEEEHYFAIKMDGQSITKIGQYPSFSRRETESLKKYKNLISKYYTELTTSVNLYSQGLGIGSFVYLRRILEHLVETKYYALPEHEETARFIDKLKAVQEVEAIIPPELEEIKEQVYSVLSKGIHEYSEDECYDLYNVVFYVVTAILDRELHKKEQAEKVAAAKKAIIGKLKK